MPRLRYDLPHASPAQIVEDLKARGLIVQDRDYAEHKIALMGYTRLYIYIKSRLEGRGGRFVDGTFIEGTTFENILNIHDFDRRIRVECLLAVKEFEILLRNSISEILSANYGTRPYDNSAIFNPGQFGRMRRMFREKYRTSKNLLIREFKREYEEAEWPPSEWPPISFMKEMMTFGDVARLFKALDAKTICVPIAESFGIPSKGKLTPWIDALVDLRNACAHHDRIFNHSFDKTIVPLRVDGRSVPAEGVRLGKLAALLQCLDHMTRAHGAPVEIEKTVMDMVDHYEEIDSSEIGYPRFWTRAPDHASDHESDHASL